MTITADYDPHADVLYVALDRPRPAYCEEGDGGLLFRYADEDEAPCGVTVLACDALWHGRQGELARRIGNFLSTPPQEVERALIRAFAR